MIDDEFVPFPETSKTTPPRASKWFYLPAGFALIYGVVLLGLAIFGYVGTAIHVYGYATDPTVSIGFRRRIVFEGAMIYLLMTILLGVSVCLLLSVPRWVRGHWRRAFALDVVGLLMVVVVSYLTVTFSSHRQ